MSGRGFNPAVAAILESRRMIVSAMSELGWRDESGIQMAEPGKFSVDLIFRCPAPGWMVAFKLQKWRWVFDPMVLSGHPARAVLDQIDQVLAAASALVSLAASSEEE